MGKLLSRENDRQGHHHQLNVGDGHPRPLDLLLSIHHHVDKLGNAIGLGVVLVHVGPESNHVDGVEPLADGVEERHDVPGGDLGVEGLGILEVIVPSYFLDGFSEEFGNAPLSHLVAVEVIEARFMCRFSSDVNDGCGVVSDARVVEGET